MSLTEAAKMLDIPKTTLHDKCSGKYKGDKIGRKPALQSLAILLDAPVILSIFWVQGSENPI